MNLAAVLIGIPSLLFGLLIAYGLIRRFNGNLNDAQKKTAGFWEFVRIFPGWSECRFGSCEYSF
tara:strand:+ start:319 stop:510 length:192 start_codon:yes stop_codon:yes gene_type:complete